MLSQNYKLKHTSQIMHAKVNNFGIPSIQTCFGAKDCIKYCYVKKGLYNYPNVKASQQRNLDTTKTDDFLVTMFEEIVMKASTHIRIHDSGDFYSKEYLDKWLYIIESLPHVQFYAYTKSLPLFINRTLPSNFTIIFSYGGKYDHLIDDTKHRHSKIFKSKQELIKAKYLDASEIDLVAISPKSHKIGLIYH